MTDDLAAAVEAELLSKHATVWGRAFDVVGQSIGEAVGYYGPFVEGVLRRLLPSPPGSPDQPRHVVLGMDPGAYEQALEEGRNRAGGWEGMPVSKEPRWHSHPDLGISGHAHSGLAAARTSHTHRLAVVWSHNPEGLEGDIQW